MIDSREVKVKIVINGEAVDKIISFINSLLSVFNEVYDSTI